jgi:DNA-binding NtrC family response regulator
MPLSGTNNAKILIVDDEEGQRRALSSLVTSWGFSAETAQDGQEALDRISSWAPQVIVTDLMMPRMDGFELLRHLNREGFKTPAIVLTAFGNIETAIATLHDLKAFWFLEKPVPPSALRVLLERAVAHSRLLEETERLQRQMDYQNSLCELVGASAGMQHVFSLIQQVAPSRAAVLVTGESGTGKELVARAIHSLSPRREGPFVAINCAAMPETLMESELFGHEKGAFTGAVERRAGCFELANGGTLLLDEIGDMPQPTQAKLLRVLEDSKVRRLGGKTETLVDVRVIASTNRNLEESIKKGSFREDLYYRLNVFEIPLPPLRQHMEDVPILADSLIRDLNRKHGTKANGLHPDALDLLRRHSWPGNVRELRNVLERAMILAGEGQITTRHLPRSLGGTPTAREALQSEDTTSVRLPVGITVGEAEKALIQLTLQHTKNNKTRAAEILGISLKTLFNKLKEYGAAEKEEQQQHHSSAS